MNILFFVKDTYMMERIGIQTLSSILQKMEDFKPDVLCYTVTTGEHTYFLDLNRQLKKKYKVFSIFGGIHATFVPEMVEEDGVDVVCRGEGDDAILELIQALRDGRPYDQIKNLWVKNPDGTIVRN